MSTETELKAMAAAASTEYEEYGRRLGLTKEWAFLQRTPMGDFVVVVQEADDPGGFMQKFAASNNPFDIWFKEKVKAIHGLDLTAPPPPPELKIHLGI